MAKRSAHRPLDHLPVRATVHPAQMKKIVKGDGMIDGTTEETTGATTDRAAPLADPLAPQALDANLRHGAVPTEGSTAGDRAATPSPP